MGLLIELTVTFMVCSPSPRQADRSAYVICNVSDCQLVNIPGCVGAVHDVKPPNNLLAVIRRNAADFNGDISRIGIAKIARFRAAQIFEERDRIAIVKIVFGCDLACLAPVRLCPPAFAAGSTGIFPLNYHDTSGLKGLHAKVSRVAVTIIFHVVAPFLLVERGRLCYNGYTVPRSGGFGRGCLSVLCQGD